jgi:hypothetical protein
MRFTWYARTVATPNPEVDHQLGESPTIDQNDFGSMCST